MYCMIASPLTLKMHSSVLISLSKDQYTSLTTLSVPVWHEANVITVLRHV